ncbi:MAG: alpha-galactosidase [Saprospiraceae bacterium]|nr:alpha-galactosidase [Saprospiraceae bacterium]
MTYRCSPGYLFFTAITSLVWLLPIFTSAQTSDTLVIDNQAFKKKFFCTINSAGPLKVMVYDSNDIEICSSNDRIPYFEFVINHKLVSANDPFWQYKDHSVRRLQNEGREYRIIFEGMIEPVEGMQVILYQQTFPGATLVREKIELAAREGNFALHKWDDHLHFRFPQYALKKNRQTDSCQMTEIRLASWELKPATFTRDGNSNLVYNHMFYPDIVEARVSPDETVQVKGPVNLVYNGVTSWMTTYEHASQDNLNGILNKRDDPEPGKLVDQLQGTKGVFDFKQSDDDFRFLGISCQNEKDLIRTSLDIVRGGYLDGEQIDPDHSYETVWAASAFYPGNDLKVGLAIFKQYLWHWINEKKASRRPEFYYNTWGMQREVGKRLGPEMLRGIMTYENIFEEIDRAKDLGVDIFVLDDGWEQTQGVWSPHSERLPEGLAPIKKYLDQYHIKMGLWFSPLGIDSTAERFKNHPDWVIKDSEGHPVGAQWGHPAFDFVSDFFDLFIEDCKKLIDQGALFFKWDAINTLYSDLPNLNHGSGKYSAEELRARYEYLLPVYVTRAMQILTDYQPELVIEMDLTEARRVMLGLAPLSQGKLFFMNNGASSYNDYTPFRAKSMRSIVSVYNGIIPLELFTYANYPHNLNGALEYNVNNSLMAGHGFWGNLALTTEEERKVIGQKVEKSKRILPFITEVGTKITGQVGDSPEIYEQINAEEGAGQVLVFSEERINFKQEIAIDPMNILAVLGQPYRFTDNGLEIVYDLQHRPYTGAAIVLPNDKQHISIISSSGILGDVYLKDLDLTYTVEGKGIQEVRWDIDLGTPLVRGEHLTLDVDRIEEGLIKIHTEDTTTVSLDFNSR